MASRSSTLLVDHPDSPQIMWIWVVQRVTQELPKLPIERIDAPRPHSNVASAPKKKPRCPKEFPLEDPFGSSDAGRRELPLKPLPIPHAFGTVTDTLCQKGRVRLLRAEYLNIVTLNATWVSRLREGSRDKNIRNHAGKLSGRCVGQSSRQFPRNKTPGHCRAKILERSWTFLGNVRQYVPVTFRIIFSKCLGCF